MRKHYPYLEDTVTEDLNTVNKKRNYLAHLSDYVTMKQYVKMTLLNWEEEPLKDIEGEITSGTITKDGSSSVRHTCTMNVSFDAGEYDVDSIQMDYSINKKVFIEIGMKNYTNRYKDYPILWFPQGVFFIASFSIQSSSSGVPSANITLKDKMCGLNGDVGGKFPAAVILDSVDTQNAKGEYVSEKVRIHDIIQEMVHHYGGEPLENIIIEDVPLRIKRVVKWMGENPLWMRQQGDEDGYIYYDASLDKGSDDGVNEWFQMKQNSDVGYVYDDFVYTDELTCNLGDSVTTALDKIKQYLGNYEYFYDVFGVFHFREIKNYLNTTLATDALKDMKDKNYLTDITTGKTEYSFTDKDNIVSITNTPQYDNVKNDFIIQGQRQGTSDTAKITVRYHLVIDRKPIPGNRYYDLVIYQEDGTNLKKIAMPHSVQTRDSSATDAEGTLIGLPVVGNFNVIYHIEDENEFVYWKDDSYKQVNLIQYYAKPGADNTTYSGNKDKTIFGGYVTKDWRTELYLRGMLTIDNNTDSSMYYNNLTYDSIYKDDTWLGDIYRQSRMNKIDTDYYFEELDAFWPQIYDLEKQQFYGEDESSEFAASLEDGNYYLDFIDSQTSGLGQYSVQNIGRRVDAVNDEDVNCLFTPAIPNIVWLNTDDDDIVEQRDECLKDGQPYSQVRGEVYQNFYTGGYKNGAFEKVQSELWTHTTYQQTLSLTAVPVFYLEPNSRVSINDSTTGTDGDYMIKSISIPLGAGNVMSVTCSECVQKM